MIFRNHGWKEVTLLPWIVLIQLNLLFSPLFNIVKYMLSGGRLGCTNRLSTPWSGFKDAGEAILTDIKVCVNVRFGLTYSQNRESRRDRFSDRAQDDSVSGDFTISPHCSCDVDCFISCPLFSNSCCPEPEFYRLWWDLFNTWWFWSVDSSPPCSSSIIFFPSPLTILKSTPECGWTLQPPLCKARPARGHYLVIKVRRSYPPQTDAAQKSSSEPLEIPIPAARHCPLGGDHLLTYSSVLRVSPKLTLITHRNSGDRQLRPRGPARQRFRTRRNPSSSSYKEVSPPPFFYIFVGNIAWGQSPERTSTL